MAKPDRQNVTNNPDLNAAFGDTGKSSLANGIFKSGDGVVGGGGTVTVTDTYAKTTSSILVTNTANANAIAVTTKSDGSFVVTGTAVDTFDYLIVNL